MRIKKVLNLQLSWFLKNFFKRAQSTHAHVFRWIMSPQSWNTMKHPLQLFYEYSNTFNNYCNSNLSKISYLSLNLVIFMGIFQCKCRFSQQVLTKSYQILIFFPLKNSNAIKVSSHKYFVKLQILSIINLNRFKIPYFLKKYPFFCGIFEIVCRFSQQLLT